jgi:hypothetical protein
MAYFLLFLLVNMRSIFTSLIYLFLFTAASAQDITYGKSTFDETGDPTAMVTPEVSFLNTGPDSIEVFVNRFYKSLPANWTSCFCFISCHSPSEDTLRFFLAPMEKATIGVGFNTDSIPGIGYAKITVEQIGGTQKDTLSFSGSTMFAGIKENSFSSSLKLFPNPTSDQLIIHSSLNEKYSVFVTNLNGQVVRRLPEFTTGKTEISLSGLADGMYFIDLLYASGKTETKRIIKN